MLTCSCAQDHALQKLTVYIFIFNFPLFASTTHLTSTSLPASFPVSNRYVAASPGSAMLGQELPRGAGVSFSVVDAHVPAAFGVPGFGAQASVGRRHEVRKLHTWQLAIGTWTSVRGDAHFLHACI